MADWSAVSSSVLMESSGIPLRRPRAPRAVLVRASLALLAVTLPVTFGGVRPAAAGALAVVRERTSVLDALHAPDLLAVRAADPTGEQARLAVDGRDDTVWTGRAGETQWKWAAAFAKPVHSGSYVRASGARPRAACRRTSAGRCGPPAPGHGEVPRAVRRRATTAWTSLEGAERLARPRPGTSAAQPTPALLVRRRRRVRSAPGGRPHQRRAARAARGAGDRERARRAARRPRRATTARTPGCRPRASIDGTYARRWAGAPGKSRWTLRVDLAEPQPIDRVRLVLGFDATTSVPRAGGGRSYAIAWAPVHYMLEVSEDGRRFVAVASEPLRADGSILPLRRRLVTLPEARTVRALRLVMTGATGASGLARTRRRAGRARDRRRTARTTRARSSATPWVLSVNANPSAESQLDARGRDHQRRVLREVPAAAASRRSCPCCAATTATRARSARTASRSTRPRATKRARRSSRSRATIPLLDAQLLAQSSPPPIAVLSGSNDWDYAAETGPDPAHPKRWHWDPLRDARVGGMGQLAPAVRQRVAPFIGFCGGAQILGLLEARRRDAGVARGRPAAHRPRAAPHERPAHPGLRAADRRRARVAERSAPAAREDPVRRRTTRSSPTSAGPQHRSTTQALPESHSDAVRPDAFLPGGPARSASRCSRRARSAARTSSPPARATASSRTRAARAGATPCPRPSARADRGWPVIGDAVPRRAAGLRDARPRRSARVGRRRAPLLRGGLRADGRRVREARALSAIRAR